MANPKIKIHNIETGEVIEREMTTEELTAHEARLAANAVELEAIAAKEAAKAAVYQKLGLSAEEIAALLS